MSMSVKSVQTKVKSWVDAQLENVTQNITQNITDVLARRTFSATSLKIQGGSSDNGLNFSTPQAFVAVTAGKGKSAQRFVIHRNLLCHYSPFLSNLIQGDDSEFSRLKLLDVDPSIFGYFVNYLYTQKVVNKDNKDLRLIEYARLHTTVEQFKVVDLPALLLEKIRSSQPDVENDIFANINEPEESGNTLEDFQRYAYDLTPSFEDCVLKQLAVEKTIKALRQNNTALIMYNMPKEMIADFVMEMARGCARLAGWEKGIGFEGVDGAVEILDDDIEEDMTRAMILPKQLEHLGSSIMSLSTHDPSAINSSFKSEKGDMEIASSEKYGDATTMVGSVGDYENELIGFGDIDDF